MAGEIPPLISPPDPLKGEPGCIIQLTFQKTLFYNPIIKLGKVAVAIQSATQN
jgi:hypothetical protein